MFFQFLVGLFVLTFAFNLLIKIILLAFGVAFAFVGLVGSARSQDNEDEIVRPRTFLFNKILLGIVYSAFIAVVTSYYATRPGVHYSWLYAAVGFVAVFFVLGSDASEQRKTADDIFSGHSETDKAIAKGAAIGMFAGLVCFPVFYNWPGLALFIPGTETLFAWVFRFADWLTGFWIVRAFLAFVLLAVVFHLGLVAIMSGVMLFYVVLGGIRSLLGIRNKGESEQSDSRP